MESKEYKAVKNFFHNTEKIDRSAIKSLLKEAIKEIVAEEMGRIIKTCEFQDIVNNHLKWKGNEIYKAVQVAVLEKFEINVKQKDMKP